MTPVLTGLVASSTTEPPTSHLSMTSPESRLNQLRRFERLGLKWNPFRVVRPRERRDVFLPALYDSTASAFDIAHSAAPLTQIIADSGHGKSTLLAAVIQELQTADTVFESHYLPPSLSARVATPARRIQVLVIDEFERLTRLNRYQLRRWAERGHRLIVSTHRDLGVQSSAVETVRLSTVSDDGLQRYFEKRIGWAGGDIAHSQLTADATSWLLRVTAGNLRVVDAVLYEVFQRAEPDGPLIIDTDCLRFFEDCARERAEFDALGNLPPSPLRRLKCVFSQRKS